MSLVRVADSRSSNVGSHAASQSRSILAAASAPATEQPLRLSNFAGFRDKLAVDVVDFEVNGPPSLVPEKPSEAVIGVWEGLCVVVLMSKAGASMRKYVYYHLLVIFSCYLSLYFSPLFAAT